MTKGFRTALAVSAAGYAAVAAPALAQQVAFDVPAQPAATALATLARQGGVQLLAARRHTTGKTTRAVHGRMTIAQALTSLLRGTGLIARQTGPQTYSIVLAPEPVPIRPPPVKAAPARQLPSTEPAASIETREIVVTGTLIRGIAPAGPNVIEVPKRQIEETGASSTSQLLASVPQIVNFFNALPVVGANAAGGNVGFPIVRPNLRNLPSSTTGAQTLILIDGHRVVGAGITQMAVDPDVIPPAMIERVEAVTDGGSAIYGSDAIGGVINLITRRRFDGLRLDTRYGLADRYRSFAGTVTAGKDWGNGTLFASYSFARHSGLIGRDRDYLKIIDWNTGRGAFLTCNPGTVSVGARTYALPGLGPGTENACDTSQDSTFYPEESRHSVYVGLSQDIGERAKLDLRALYFRREDTGNGGPFAAFSTVTIAPSNPYYRNLPGEDANAVQTVRFDYASVFGRAAAQQHNLFEAWQITPSVTRELGGSWAARALFSYGESITSYDNLEINAAAQAAAARGTTLDTALNPYDIAATQNRTLLGSLVSHNFGRGMNRMANFRLIADGPLLALPGGELRAALGAEYMNNAFTSQVTNLTSYQLSAAARYVQRVVSLLGELQVPLFGDGNRRRGLYALGISASARYDRYSDFGGTFNPKLGLTYQPAEWLTLRAYWGRSFNAPNPAEQLRANATAILALPGGVAPAGVAIPPGAYTLLLRAGAIRNLQPQTSSNWSLGFDAKPLGSPDLQLRASYYKIDFDNILGVPDSANTFAAFFALYPDLYILHPTADQIRAAAAQTSAGLAAVDQFLQPGGPQVVSIIDVRTRNLGSARLSGLDFSARYTATTIFGSIDASLAGNYQLKLDLRGSPLAPYVDTLATGASRLRLAIGLGATAGRFRASATLYHTAGYDVARSTTLPQDRVGAYDVVNLFMRYDLPERWGRDLALSLNIDNLFDADPPVYKLSDGLSRGYANGATLGRVVQLGISKKF